MQSTSEKIFRSSLHTTSERVAEAIAATTRPAVPALVVECSPTRGWSIVKALSDSGFRVTAADTFAHAKACLIESPPALLLTDLRLREYNGLQLVLRGKAHRPTMAAIVFSSGREAVLQKEAEAMGATFVVRPIDSRELVAAAFRTLFRETLVDTIEPIRPPYERRTRERRNLSEPETIDRRRRDRRRDQNSLLDTGCRT
jgi:DNA-binding response OmpR family regulator